jgi:thioredoxin reductase (NADPH)
VRDVRSGETQALQPAAAFVFIGLDPNSAIVKGVVELDPYDYILTGHDLSHGREQIGGREPYAFETSVSGVFAAGDVRHGSTKQVASAVGEGAAAIISIRECLRLAQV